MTQAAIHEESTRAGLTAPIEQAIEQQDPNALYALAPQLARLTLADLAPLLTTIQRGMQRPSGFSIKMLNALIREANMTHIGGRASTTTTGPDRAATATPENIRSIEDYVSFSDRGNAMRLLTLHGQNLRYCHAWKQWLIYDQGRWIVDETAAIIRRCEGVIQTLYLDAGHSEDPKERKALASWALKTESFKAVNGMLSWANARAGVPVIPDELDADPWHFNVQNGTLDLKTGQLQPHQREDLISKQAPVTFDPDTQCPQWLAFLDRIMASNQNLISYLQRAVGYSLSGSRREQKMFIPFGKGRNGKSTFIDLLMDLLGDYAESTPTSTLMTKRTDGIPNDVARLKGVRFVSAQEAEKGRHLAESLVKQITGDKRISARFMHANWFTFEPICKIWLSTNHKPLIRGTDDGIWRRVQLIPFNVQIPEEEADTDLPQKLQTELPGILNWALAGCLAWQEQGLNPPDEIKAANNEYRNEQDALCTFFEEHCIFRPDARVSVQDLFRVYTSWCEESGEKSSEIMTKSQFGVFLKQQKDLTQGRTGQARYWIGIGLLSPDTSPPPPEQQTWHPEGETHQPTEADIEADQARSPETDPPAEQSSIEHQSAPSEASIPERVEPAATETYAETAYSYKDITDLYVQMAKQMPPGKKVYWDVADSQFPAQLVERSEAGTRLRTMIESREPRRVEAAVAWIRHYLSHEENSSRTNDLL